MCVYVYIGVCLYVSVCVYVCVYVYVYVCVKLSFRQIIHMLSLLFLDAHLILLSTAEMFGCFFFIFLLSFFF